MNGEPLVSVVIPVLNEVSVLPGTLDHLAALPGRFEVIVADGESADGTIEAAECHPLHPRVVAARGRAEQLNAAAAQATGEILVFLHADTRLPEDAYESLMSALADFEIVGGNFALRFDGGDHFSRVLGAVYAVQRRLGVYYGDSAVWARTSTFAALGGFRPLPIMDDYDFVRRLERRGPTACLPGPAVTSARRWQRAGLVRTVGSWVVIRWLYLAGVPAGRLAGLYRQVR
jgi:rSAM/selenodomain-associated transferase 2